MQQVSGGLTSLVLGASLLITGCAALDKPSRSLPVSGELAETANELRTDGAPAVGLAVVSCSGGNQAIVGLRQVDGDAIAGPNSLFNTGSNGKSMLAVAAISLAAKGGFSLDDPIERLWPESVAGREDKKRITLAQLLSHESGMPAFDSGSELSTVPAFSGSATEIRRQAAFYFLDQPLVSVPGAKVAYSNAGYVVASALLEHVTGMALTQILDKQVFEPFGFNGRIGEPRAVSPDGLVGHYVNDGKLVPYLDTDPPVPPFLQGAGYISLTTSDYARYVQVHLCGLLGRSAILSQASAKILHGRDRDDHVGLGWGVTELGGSLVSFHVGGTGDFTAYMAVSEAQDKAAIAVLNVGGAPASAAQRWLIATMTPAEE